MIWILHMFSLFVIFYTVLNVEESLYVPIEDYRAIMIKPALVC